MREYKLEFEKRVEWIKNILNESRTDGIVYGNSGGKDSALVGILCKAACENTLGIIMPCASKRNFEEDTEDAMAVAAQFNIDTMTIDLTDARENMLKSFHYDITDDALKNIAPRLRMTTLYALGQSRGALVAGTGNRDELYIGYFTKWGDGAADFNPIADLTVGEVYEFLEFFDAPENIIKKAPSAGLFEGQTDEAEIGITYADIDNYLLTGEGEEETVSRIEKMHNSTAHKLKGVRFYPD